MSRRGTPRRWAKRRTRRMYVRMDKMMSDLVEVKEMFDPDHPDLGEVIETIARTVQVAQALLERFYLAAWGMIPGDWHSDV